MRYNIIGIEGFAKNQQIKNCLVLMLAVFVLGYFADSTHVQLLRYLSTVALGIASFFLIFLIRTYGFPSLLCMILGCATIILAGLVPDNIPITKESLDPTAFWFEQIDVKIKHAESAREFIHTYSLYIGVFCISLGMVFAHRPSLVQVRNYLPFEYPYPIWNSKNQPRPQYSPDLVPVRKFLTNEERMLLCRFRYLLISIDGNSYLVSPDEKIPQNAIMVRTKSNSLCGVSKS